MLYVMRWARYSVRPCSLVMTFKPELQTVNSISRPAAVPTIIIIAGKFITRTYGSSAWWGFASPTDRQRIQAFIRRSGFTLPDLPSFTDLCREADNNLFDSILNNSHHVLRYLLPPPSQASQHYSLRSRRHNLQLSIGPTSLPDRNFLHRMLYSDSCWHIFLSSIVHVQRCVLPMAFNIKGSSISVKHVKILFVFRMMNIWVKNLNCLNT